jgi:hypothetical protein
MERSTRGGGWDSWNWIGPNVPDAENYPSGSLFYPPVEVCGRVVAQAGRSVFISSDGGTSWTSVSLPGIAGIASAMVIPVPTRIYVGTMKGRIYRIELVNNAWANPIFVGAPVGGAVSDILVDQTNPNRLWVTYSSLGPGTVGGGIFRSDDAGSSWHDVSAGLPDIALNAVEIDPQNPDTVYVAADVGIYRSTDAGAVWMSFNNKLPNALVKDLAFHPRSRLLRAATQSRGVWEIAVDQTMMPTVEVYIRDSAVDSGRNSPSPSGVDDPFNFGSQTFWWQCQDIKVDSPSFQNPSASAVDFEFFEDDHGIFAAGLKDENPQRNRTVRVFVQLHNRGIHAATNVAVKIFFAASAVALPNLPTGFWNGFPNNVLPPTSPWQQISPHKLVDTIDSGGTRIVAFDWTVPANAPTNISLLAIISADNDPLSTSELNIAALVQDNKKCGLKNMVTVNPLPTVGPPLTAVTLHVGRVNGSTKYSLGADRAATSMIRGVVLSKRLSVLARKAKVKQIKPTSNDNDELRKLMFEAPKLKKALDTQHLFAITDGVWLENVTLKGKTPDPIVFLLNAEMRKNRAGSIVQTASDGTIVGGFTFQAN